MSFSTVHSSFLSQFACEARSFPFSHRAVSSSEFKINSVLPITPRMVSMGRGGGDGGGGGGLGNDSDEGTDEDEDEDEDQEDLDDDIGAQRVTERTVLTSRRGSRCSRSANAFALSRSTSPLSHSGSFASSNSNSNSPLSPMSRSDILSENGGVQPLGNILDPVVSPMLFAQHPIPKWTS